ncbi:hypothetical protein AB5N19_00613 [Seiridium cardinale]
MTRLLVKSEVLVVERTLSGGGAGLAVERASPRSRAELPVKRKSLGCNLTGLTGRYPLHSVRLELSPVPRLVGLVVAPRGPNGRGKTSDVEPEAVYGPFAGLDMTVLVVLLRYKIRWMGWDQRTSWERSDKLDDSAELRDGYQARYMQEVEGQVET